MVSRQKGRAPVQIFSIRRENLHECLAFLAVHGDFWMTETIKFQWKSNKDYKQTIVMITHNMEIAKCADRIIELEDGKIVRE